MAALGGKPLELGYGGIDIPNRKQTAWDEAAGIGAAPFIDMPIVIGAQVGKCLRLVLGLYEEAAVNHREAREIERCGDPVDIHVSDTGVDIITTGTELRERRRLHAVFLARPADDGIQPD